MKKYYKHTYKVIVLSESPDEDDIDCIAYNVTEGEDVLFSFSRDKLEVLNEREISQALFNCGSEPSFFMIDDK